MSIYGTTAQASTLTGDANSGTITMSIQGPVTTLNPTQGLSYQDGQVDEALYDTLVFQTAKRKIIPRLASSWTTNPTKDVFTIKSGATCSDGTPVTPEVVAASLRYYVAPSTNASGLSDLIGTGNTATVTSDDSNHTVTISLAHPFGGVLISLSRASTGIICPAGLANPSLMATHSEGSGPFVMTSEVSGSTYTMKRRKNYTWGPKIPGQPKGRIPSQLIVKVVTDESTGANLMLTRGLDISQFTGPNVSRVQHQKGYSSTTQPQSVTFLMFNEQPGRPTARESVRLAISRAVKRTAVNNAQSNGRGQILNSLGQSPFTCKITNPSSLIPKYKPSAAKSTLKGVKLNMIGTQILNNGAGQTYVQAALGTAGASVNLRNMNNEAWVNDITTGKNDWDMTILVLGNGSGDFFSSSSFMTGATPPHGLNIANINNSAANAAAQAGSMAIGTQQCSGFGEMQSLLLKRHDIFPMATAPVVTVFNNRVVGTTSFGVMSAGSFRLK